MSKPTLHLFWVAEYHACPSGEAQGDGLALPQFDPDTGDEHLFSEIDQARLKRFGWYRFPPQLVKKVPGAIFNPALNRYTVDIPISQSPNLQSQPRLIAYRTTTLEIKPDGTPKSHEASEYVLGLSTADCRLPTLLHIYTDGRVELR